MKYVYSLVLLLCISVLNAQEYAQQEVHSTIHVQLNDKAHSLTGDITMVYINHSPDTLDFIWMHLWPNAYASEETALAQQLVDYQNETEFYFAEEDARGSIRGLNFSANDKELRCLIKEDLAKVVLNDALLPGDTLVMETPFRVKIPEAGVSRLGHEEQSYQISQWFPKPAVYDRDGWHPMHYLNQGEFYSEFGSYNVYITVPLSYRVAATGQLMTKSENLWLDELRSAQPLRKQLQVRHPLADSGAKEKVLHFYEENVHDFAWFADRRFLIRSDEAILHNGDTVYCETYVRPENSHLWRYGVRTLQRSVTFYSQHVGAYPYKTLSAVDGALEAGGGMEYPTITVVSGDLTEEALEVTLMHEVGHNWFYGILGFNERDEPWLDEGLNTFYQNLYMEHYYPNRPAFSDFIPDNVPNTFMGRDAYPASGADYLSWLFMARRNLDQPIGLGSEDYTMINYFVLSYFKSAAAWQYLMSYLGEDEWSALMQGFYNEWKFKHPRHQDIEAYLVQNASKDISWFFEAYLASQTRVDYALTKAKKQENGTYQVTVKNRGRSDAPVKLSAYDKKGTLLHSVWVDSLEKKQQVMLPAADYKYFQLDANMRSLDMNTRNNDIQAKGLLKRVNNPLPGFLYRIPVVDRYPNFWLPALAWNEWDGFMLGGLLYNDWVFEQRWQYRVMPLYSFGRKNIRGGFQTYYNWYPKGEVQRISLGIGGRSYTYENNELTDIRSEDDGLIFQQVKGEIDVLFKNKADKSKLINRVNLSWFYINKEVIAYDPVKWLHKSEQSYGVWRLGYTYQFNRALNPYGFHLTAEQHNEQLKVSVEFKYHMNYSEKKGLDVRLFAGQFFGAKSIDIDDRFRLSSWDGSKDYLYEDVFPARGLHYGKTLWSQQMLVKDGGFAVPSVLYSSDWMLSLGLKSHLIGPRFLRVYSNMAYMPLLNENKLFAEAGVCISVWRDALEVYLPVFISDEIREINELNRIDAYKQIVRFHFDFNKLNAFDYLRHIKL